MTKERQTGHVQSVETKEEAEGAKGYLRNGANCGGHSMLGSEDLNGLSQGSTCTSLWLQNLSGVHPRSHDPQLSASHQPSHSPPPPSIYSALVPLWLGGTWALLIHENDFS